MVEKKYKNKKRYTIYKTIVSTMSWIILTILGIIGAALLFVLINTKINEKNNKTPLVSLYTIISPSMRETLDVWDVVVVKRVDTKTLKEKDIISFYSTSEFFGNTPITHRIVRIINADGQIKYETQGDANDDPDLSLVTEDRIVGKVIFKIPQLGRVQYFLISKAGWLIALVIPALAIIIYDGVKIVKLSKIRKKMSVLTTEEEKKERDEDLKI